MVKFAANLSMMFNEVAFLDRFAAAAEAGFKAVEFLFPYDFSPEEIAARLEQNGLEIALFNLPPGDWAGGERGLASLPDRKDEFRASVATALTYAKAAKAKRLHMMAGNARDDDPVAISSYEESLRYAADALGEAGLDLVIEPINRRDMPPYFLADFDKAAAFIADADRPNLKLQFDIYHRQITHGDVIKGLEQHFPLIGHVQIASVPLRNEPGTGELDDFRVLRHLDALGYDGFVGCEYRPAKDTTAGLGWLKAFGPEG